MQAVFGSPSESKYRTLVTYWQENRRTKNIVARRTSFVGGTAALTEYHRVDPHEDILIASSNVDDLFESVANWAYRHAR